MSFQGTEISGFSASLGMECVGRRVEKVKAGARPGPAGQVGRDGAISLAQRTLGLPPRSQARRGKVVCWNGGQLDLSCLWDQSPLPKSWGPERTPASKARRTCSPCVCWGRGAGFQPLDPTRFGRCHYGILSVLPSLKCHHKPTAQTVTVTSRHQDTGPSEAPSQ